MIEIHNLEKTDSVFNQYMAELRDAVIQQDRMRFRRNLERIGEIMAYEISKSFEYDDEEVTTPLGIKQIRTMHEQPVIATILRAGLPFHNGMLSMFDQADSAFIPFSILWITFRNLTDFFSTLAGLNAAHFL